MHDFFFRAFGLDIQTNIPISGLIPLQPTNNPDVKIHLGNIPPEARTDADTHSTELNILYEQKNGTQINPKYWTTAEQKYFCLEYIEGPCFVINNNGTNVWAEWPSELTMDELVLYLIGPVMGFTLRMRGTLCLHASAIAIGELAIAIAGPSGAGKSTTAAAFVKMGYPLLSDDILPLELNPHQLLVSPGYPRIKLWSDSVRHFHGDENALPQLLPDWDKRYLDLSGNIHLFHDKPRPLGAIYILDSRIASDTPEINDLVGTEAILALVKNTYRNELLSISMRAQELISINKVVSLAPIRLVQPPMDIKNISRLCDAITEDLSEILTTAHSNAL